MPIRNVHFRAIVIGETGLRSKILQLIRFSNRPRVLLTIELTVFYPPPSRIVERIVETLNISKFRKSSKSLKYALLTNSGNLKC